MESIFRKVETDWNMVIYYIKLFKNFVIVLNIDWLHFSVVYSVKTDTSKLVLVILKPVKENPPPNV